MTTPENEPAPVEPENNTPEQPVEAAETPVEQESSADEVSPEEEEVEQDERKRRLLLLLLLLLLVCLCCCCGVIANYWLNPRPLTEMVVPAQANVCFQPTYKFSIPNVNGPVAVAVSPDYQRLYAAESDGERLVKIFDRNGTMLSYFAPPGTDAPNREPKYMAISPDGRVFVVDRKAAAIYIYDPNGVLIDGIIGQHMTLSKYMASKGASGVITNFEGINNIITYGAGQKLTIEYPADEPQWSPLGLRFDEQGNLIYTDTTEKLHSVHIIPAADLGITVTPGTPPTFSGTSAPLTNFNPGIVEFGAEGQGNDQFSFPQVVVKDTRGNFYISDSNNSRIAVWTPDAKYKTFFAFGSKEGALNLPRGLWMDKRDCLLVADAVGSKIRVYDVSGDEPTFSFEIGGYGFAEGLFNYPIDVIIDGTGRLYIADRANNRIQVWSY
jgi:DNA-binding beta-propeller fold protein YncE